MSTLDVDVDSTSTLITRVLTLLTSVSFVLPLSAFIDSIAFSFTDERNDTENAHVHYDYHVHYQKLFQSQCECHLAHEGDDQQGVAQVIALLLRYHHHPLPPAQCAVRTERTEGQSESSLDEGNRVFLSYVLAVDDFFTFKALCFQRNCQLEQEAWQLMLTQNQHGSTHTSHLSRGMSHEDDMALEDDIALKRVLALSLQSSELDKAAHDREEADLALAIAMSLALDKQIQTSSLENKTQPVYDQEVEESESSATIQACDSPHDSSVVSGSYSSPPAKRLSAPSSLSAVQFQSKRPWPIEASSAVYKNQIDNSDILSESTTISTTKAVVVSSSSATALDLHLSASELAKRREFLKQQRDIIIAKNQQKAEEATKLWKNLSNDKALLSSQPVSSVQSNVTGITDISYVSPQLIEALRDIERKRQS